MLAKEKMRIENARLFPAAIVDQVQTALSDGAQMSPDKSRKNFYDVETEDRTYFIYVSPVSGNITLIATWRRKRSSADANSHKQGSWRRRITEHILAA